MPYIDTVRIIIDCVWCGCCTYAGVEVSSVTSVTWVAERGKRGEQRGARVKEGPNRNGCIVLDDYLTMACVDWMSHDQVKVLEIVCGPGWCVSVCLSILVYKYVPVLRCCNLFGLLFENYTETIGLCSGLTILLNYLFFNSLLECWVLKASLPFVACVAHVFVECLIYPLCVSCGVYLNAKIPHPFSRLSIWSNLNLNAIRFVLTAP